MYENNCSKIIKNVPERVKTKDFEAAQTADR